MQTHIPSPLPRIFLSHPSNLDLSVNWILSNQLKRSPSDWLIAPELIRLLSTEEGSKKYNPILYL